MIIQNDYKPNYIYTNNMKYRLISYYGDYIEIPRDSKLFSSKIRMWNTESWYWIRVNYDYKPFGDPLILIKKLINLDKIRFIEHTIPHDSGLNIDLIIEDFQKNELPMLAFEAGEME